MAILVRMKVVFCEKVAKKCKKIKLPEKGVASLAVTPHCVGRGYGEGDKKNWSAGSGALLWVGHICASG